MTPAECEGQFDRDRDLVKSELNRQLQGLKNVPARLEQAMRYSLMAGGKRLRPILVLWFWDAFHDGGLGAAPRSLSLARENVLAVAAAVEMLHTYSLIHDDLPAMDDDELRRGQPTCHMAFDEATAILAGDGLQSLAFGILAAQGGSQAGPLVQLLAEAVGPAGMVGGQQRDLDAEKTEVGADEVKQIHLDKTARLLMASAGAGALLAGTSPAIQAAIAAAMQHLGLAFQGSDDLLDVVGTTASLGKTTGKDAAAGKATWVRVEGLAKARQRTERLGREGMAQLGAVLPPNGQRDCLLWLGERLWQRGE